MIYYKLINITINAERLAKVIIDIVVRHHGLHNLIVINKGTFFTSKFQSSVCYFLKIKHWEFTAFHPQINSQTKRQNNTIEAYLKAFVNFKQNGWARLLLMANFGYNNVKNTSTSHMLF